MALILWGRRGNVNKGWTAEGSRYLLSPLDPKGFVEAYRAVRR
jgi:hypothetical protein